jgi:cyclophilin family peptidyl-prolyl cis-trans isomerase
MKTLLMLAAAAAATPAIKPAPAPSEIVAAAPASDWVTIAASDLLVMDLANGKRVVIQLMPPPFSQGWVGNIRKLAAARWWDGTSINRVQDNYVVQWGDATEKKVLPTELKVMTAAEYTSSLFEWQDRNAKRDAERQSRQASGIVFLPRVEPEPYPAWHSRDAYSPQWVDFYSGWPVATSGYSWDQVWWPVHCYGMVGVGRDMPPNTGTGAELYTVIGHAPRHLDRNIALVGRVISGIEHLSSLPRGTGTLGFYEKPEERVSITSIRIGTEIKDLPRYEYLSTESKSFATYADARANRRDPFFIVPAGGADICNIPVPVRVAK